MIAYSDRGSGNGAETPGQTASANPYSLWPLQRMLASPVPLRARCLCVLSNRRSRSWLQKLLFLMLSVAVVVPRPSWGDDHCDPLLLLIEGGSASSGGQSMEELMETLSVRYKGRTMVAVVDNGPFVSTRFWIPYHTDDDAEDLRRLALAVGNTGFWPVVVVGHSLGGAIAYKFTHLTQVSLLVTLDAVGSPDDVRRSGAESWINVYAYNRFFLFGPGNSIGEDWELERNADVNIKMEDTRHGWVHTMYNKVEDRVLRALDKCTQRPTEIADGLDPRAVNVLCSNPYVKCSDN